MASLRAPNLCKFEGARSGMYSGWGSPCASQKLNIIPLFKTHVTIPLHFDDSLHMHEKTHCSTAQQQQEQYSQLTTEKKW